MDFCTCGVCHTPTGGHTFFVDTVYCGRVRTYDLVLCPDCRDLIELMLDQGGETTQRRSARRRARMQPALLE
jgi:hypothetical protein